MSRGIASLVLAAASLALAAAGLRAGALAAFLVSPLSLFLAYRALMLRGDPGADVPRRCIGVGVAALGVSPVVALAGSPVAGAVVAVAAAAVLYCASQLSLDLEPPSQAPPLTKRFHPALAGAVAADELFKLRWDFARRIRHRPEYERIAAAVRAAADRNHEEGWIDYPERSHLAPPPLEKPHLVRRRVRGLPVAWSLRFPSEFDPQDPEIAEAYLGVPGTRTAQALLLRHGGAPRPALLCVHGTGLGNDALDAHIWDAAWLHEGLGLDVAILALPMQAPRAPRRAGAGLLDLHPLWIGAAFSQSVWELRRLAGWLRAEGAPTVGVAGIGRGGAVAAVMASVGEKLACAVPIAPIASLESFAWSQLSERARVEVRAAGLSEHLIGDAWARNAPLRFRPQVPHEARLVVGARADRIVPPRQVVMLWDHWGRPAVHWTQGTHFVWRGRRELRAELGAFLRRTLLAGEEVA